MWTNLFDSRWYWVRYRTGQTPPIVFIHGAGSDHTVWGDVARNLSGLTIYAIDLPGHGKSSGPPLTTIEAMSENLIQWLHREVHEPVILAGHSMGGAITQMTALLAPHDLAGIILIGTGARLRVHPDLLERLKAGKKKEAVDWLLSWAFAPGPNKHIEKIRKNMLKCPLETLLADFLACNAFDMMDRLHEIQCPALVIGMEEDKLTPPKYAHYLKDHLLSASDVIIPQSGHMVMIEQPVALADAIRQWYTQRFSSS